jgi:hypothetical protein
VLCVQSITFLQMSPGLQRELMLHHLHMLFVQDFLDGQEFDSTAAIVKCAAFLHSVVGEGEGNVEAALAGVTAYSARRPEFP